MNESVTAPAFFSTTEVDGFLDESAEVIAEEVQSLKKSVVVARRPGIRLYALDSLADNILSPFRVYAREEGRRLEFRTMRQLDDIRTDWWDTQTNDPVYWFPVSWDTFGIWPGMAEGGGTFEVEYLSWPRALTTDTQVPEHDERLQDGMVIYGVYLGMMKKWDIQRATDHFVRFVNYWGDAAAKKEARQFQAQMLYRQTFAREWPMPPEKGE